MDGFINSVDMSLSKHWELVMVREYYRASQVALVVKNPPANAGDTRGMNSIPGSGRSSEVGNGNPLQHSCLENSMDRRAWWSTIHGVTKIQT